MDGWTSIFEVITSGALLAWTACLLVGCRLLAPDLAVAVGVAGLWIGWECFRKLGLPPGPMLYDVEIVPGLFGTTLVLLLALLARDRWERWRDGSGTPPPPRDLSAHERRPIVRR